MAIPPHQHDLPVPPRKSSKAVPLTIVGVLSVMLVGAWVIADDDDDVTADCVIQLADGTYQIVDDDYCDDDDGTHHYYSGSRGAYHWYYGGTRTGNTVHGGTTYRPSDVNITTRAGKQIQRGGFGSHGYGGS